MNKTDFKTLIVILVVLLIFSIIVLILYNITEKEKVDMSGNFIVDGNRFFEYNGTKWSDLGSIDSIIMNIKFILTILMLVVILYPKIMVNIISLMMNMKVMMLLHLLLLLVRIVK